MTSVELSELAIDLRLNYKLDTELKWDQKYPLTVFRSKTSKTVKVKFDSIIKTYDLAIVKEHPKNTATLEDYTEYVKKLSRKDTILRIVKVLGL